MPPRKSNASIASNVPGEDGGTETLSTAQKLGVDDLSLPKSMIARLAKGVLPANTQIQKDALLALHKSATVFVNYIASNSNELTLASGKKTISPQDVMTAIKDVELEAFLPRLEAELKKYNETQCDKRNSYRHRVKQEKAAAATTKDGEDEDAAATGSGIPGSNGTANSPSRADGDERPVKKLKGLDGVVIVPSADNAEDGGDDDDGQDGEADEEDEEEEEDDEEDDDDDQDEDVEDDEDDETAEAADEVENPTPMHDEALDEPDSE